ncbi:UvrABC system protein C [Proteiniphilum saccharofermentans]|uniref:UvrABC system protein C n=1 Tax=Proteiniphilum saccharofermentans TaxID=1642647 RepID=A0A1R3SR39_9BACT|nr:MULTISPECIES: excinuclease ABC subunit UvrC [Proteiniphilum]MDY9917883.1 excinuclease ABC subunit UvrC [Proteiniphilum sp.]SCD18886.1 UvrABC system protein C [Proteiniphilum saccharofermentans]SDZ77413.1 Excinuclease ABC subunit C [Porphyromonadaceae bacterium KH3R12]SFS38836.1 Excinuclease ABC subunit C [Porphyromonadaceae bacterium NLAE-zl-C104]
MTDEIKNTLAVIPHQPGCYQFLDENDTVIYVGKAKDLKKRVSSYFNKHHDHPKTRILVRKIRKIKYIVVNSEEDTFLLENNLIKKLKPRYNVMLKDDKSYPFIVVKNEYFPRVYKTRNIVKDGSKYFGPYTSVQSVNALLDIFRRVYKIRTCRLNLTPENIAAGKFKVCLEYHIKRCEGPCEALQSLAEYNKNIEEIIEILKGNVAIIERQIHEKMQTLAGQLRFEEAHRLKEKLLLIQNFREKSQVVSNINYNLDVFSIEEAENSAYINYLHVVNGAVNQAYTFEYKKKLDESPEELLGMGIVEMRQRFGSDMKEVIVPFIPDLKLPDVEFTIPQRGEKRKLLSLSEKNVKQYKIDKLKKAEMLNPEQRATRILKGVQNDLRLKEIPWHIECFDNSNIQGTNPVAACVVFKKAKPSKKDYRHYNVKTVVGPDDFASMREIIERRYSRLLNEGAPLPQLIVIDGGKGQLHAAVESLQKIGLYGKIAIIGIAKRLEEIYFPEDPIPLYIDKSSETLKLIQQARDEAHRFGITFHRQKRSKSQTTSELDQVKGIGPETKKRLLIYFKSIKRIKEATKEELISVIGKSKGEIIWKWITRENEQL